MKKLISLTICIPTFNNSHTIVSVIDEALDVAKKTSSTYRIVVLNDGSTDKTVEILKHYKRNPAVTILTHAVNQGYGRTIGELYSQGGTSKWLFTLPGDHQIHPNQLLRLVPHQDTADMIIGWRVKRHDPAIRLMQSWIYNTLLRLFFGLPIHDVNSVRLMRTHILKEIMVSSRSAFVDAELCIKANQLGHRIKEVAIDHHEDLQKGSGGNWKTIIGTLNDMVRNVGS